MFFEEFLEVLYALAFLAPVAFISIKCCRRTDSKRDDNNTTMRDTLFSTTNSEANIMKDRIAPSKQATGEPQPPLAVISVFGIGDTIMVEDSDLQESRAFNPDNDSVMNESIFGAASMTATERDFPEKKSVRSGVIKTVQFVDKTKRADKGLKSKMTKLKGTIDVPHTPPPSPVHLRSMTASETEPTQTLSAYNTPDPQRSSAPNAKPMRKSSASKKSKTSTKSRASAKPTTSGG